MTVCIYITFIEAFININEIIGKYIFFVNMFYEFIKKEIIKSAGNKCKK
jgi:hypothetical protein